VIRFFDTSALAKRYVEEPGSAMVRAALLRHAVVVARVTLAEVAAAVARAARNGSLTQAQRDTILGRLPADFAKLQVVEIRPALVARVPALVARYPLRAYDATFRPPRAARLLTVVVAAFTPRRIRRDRRRGRGAGLTIAGTSDASTVSLSGVGSEIKPRLPALLQRYDRRAVGRVCRRMRWPSCRPLRASPVR
jgi:predicted nucleic acid-binding protein